MLYLWRHALHAHSSNNAITGTSTSSASCCDEKLAAVTRGVMLARVASHGMSCECWPLLCEFASRSRTACIIHAHRSSLDRNKDTRDALDLVVLYGCQRVLLLSSLGGAGRLSGQKLSIFFSHRHLSIHHISLWSAESKAVKSIATGRKPWSQVSSLLT